MASTTFAPLCGEATRISPATLRALEGDALQAVAAWLAGSILQAVQDRGALCTSLSAPERAAWAEAVKGALRRLPDGVPVFWQGLLSAIHQEREERETPGPR